MDPKVNEILDAVVREAALELFEAYKVQLDDGLPDAPLSDDIYASTIGYTGKSMGGALIIKLCRDLVAKSIPEVLRQAGMQDSMMVDWTGELSNQLLGRIKKKLFGWGVEIMLSTPVVFRGKGLSFYPQQADISRILMFGHGTGHIEVMFQAKVPRDFSLVRAEGTAPKGLDEGEVSLF